MVKKLIFILLFAISSITGFAYVNGTLWPGKTIRLEVDASMGYLNPQWSVDNPTVKLSGSGFYRNIVADSYFGGTCIITCSYDYYVGSSKLNSKKTWEYDCADNTLKLSPTTMNIGIGNCSRLNWTHSSSTYLSPSIQFSGYDPTIISVSSDGEVTGISEGETIVYAHSNLGTATPQCKIKVSDVYTTPSSILMVSNATLKAGDTYQILPEVVTETTSYTINWTSSNPEIATVNSTGLVQGIAAGESIITAKLSDESAEAHCLINVYQDIFQLTASQPEGIVEKGSKISLSCGLANSVIYYTTDGRNPIDNPTLYSDPITIDGPMIINAVAYNKDYGLSEVITLSYDVTTLLSVDITPDKNSSDICRDVTPTIVFNQPIFEEDITLVSLKNSLGEIIPVDLVVKDKTLITVPKEFLGYDNYELRIPPYTLINSNGEPNAEILLEFHVSKLGNEYVKQAECCGLLLSNGNLLINTYMEESKTFEINNVDSMFLNFNYPYNQYYYLGTDNKLWGWGYKYKDTTINGVNCIGTGSTENVYAPSLILSNVIDFKNSQYHKGALTANGKLYMWGANFNGMNGNGSSSGTQASPVSVLSNVMTFDVGQLHTVALTTNGTLYGWGHSHSCGLWGAFEGDPTELASNVKYVCSGDRYNLFLKNDDTLWSFGESKNYGSYSLGIGSSYSDDYCPPTQILSDVVKCVASLYESAAIKSNGDLYEWGLASGTTNYKLSPTPKFAMQNVKDVQISYKTTYALKNDGTVWTRGENGSGQLGLGNKSTLPKYYTEFQQVDIDNVERIWSSAHNCYALKNDGSLWGWGSSLYDGHSYMSPTLLRTGNAIIEGINISPKEIDLKLGEKDLLNVTTSPKNAYYETIDWSSSDESIVTVNSRGIINALSEGTSIINATLKTDIGFTFTTSCIVNVVGNSGIQSTVSDQDEIVIHAYDEVDSLLIDNLIQNDLVTIYSIEGKRLFSKPILSENSVRILAPQGIYIVTLERFGQKRAIKIVKK